MNYKLALQACPDYVLNVLLVLAVKKEKYQNWGLYDLANDIQDTIDRILSIGIPAPEGVPVKTLAELKREQRGAV